MRNDETGFNKFFKATIAIIVVAWLVGLALVGLIVWAIIKLVTHFT